MVRAVLIVLAEQQHSSRELHLAGDNDLVSPHHLESIALLAPVP